MEITAGLSALRSASDLTRSLREAAKSGSLKPDEFAGRIAEVYDYISDSKEALLGAQETISKLLAENEKFKTNAFHHSVSWKRLPDGKEDGPFCPTCVSERTDMRLILQQHVDQTQELWHLRCPKSHVGPGGGREQLYPIPKNLVPADRYSAR